MRKRWTIVLIMVGVAVVGTVATTLIFSRPLDEAALAEARLIARRPRIQPEYFDVVIPPNIAPLNFRIEESGDQFVVRIHAVKGGAVEIVSRSPEIVIPPGAWRRLLMENRGNTLTIDVFVRREAAWWRYGSLKNRIAEEEIDSHIVYRRLRPDALYYRTIGIYQRDLESYRESAVLDGRWFGEGCVHCHAFQERNPARMSLNFRGRYGDGCLFAHDGQIHTLAARLGHAAWHPSGKVVAFSRFDIQLFYHTARMQTRDAMDSNSDLAYYRLDRRELKTVAAIADPFQLETQPSWSPDGRYLYFASAAKLWPDYVTFPSEYFSRLRYDLKRVRYDVEADRWGPVETVLSAEQTGKSNANPRVSPDGRFLLFTLCDHGNFALYQPESDLYVLNLEDGKYRKLECNSEFAESWHSWSSNGRWIVFSSKRPTGIFTRLYLAYLDSDGRAAKPFLLPQRDPGFYDDFLGLYTLPEFVDGPIAASPRALLSAVRDTNRVPVEDIFRMGPARSPSGHDRLRPE